MSASAPYKSIILFLIGSYGSRPDVGSGLHSPTKVFQISKAPVFIATSFFLFNAIAITKAASGSS